MKETLQTQHTNIETENELRILTEDELLQEGQEIVAAAEAARRLDLGATAVHVTANTPHYSLNGEIPYND